MTKPSADQSSQPQHGAASGNQIAQHQPQQGSFSLLRTKSEFLEWVDLWSQQKLSLEGITSLLKRNRDDKRMYEEALPVYHYVCRFYRERSGIEVMLPGNSGNFDGQIFNSDGSLIEHVEVTLPFAPTDHLERSQLGAGLKLAEFYGSFESYSLDQSVSLIDAAIGKKLGKTYPPETVLLVVLPPGMVAEDDDLRFNEVLKKLQPIPATSKFRRILVMECGGAFWGEPPPSSMGASAGAGTQSATPA